MTTIRNFCCNDLLRFSSANLDQLSVTASMQFYMSWLGKYPYYLHVAIAPGNRFMGYLIGALDIEPHLAEDEWNGLTIFLNVASDYRRQKLGTTLMRLFETQMLERKHSIKKREDPYYMCLYIGAFNLLALRFFSKIGLDMLAS